MRKASRAEGKKDSQEKKKMEDTGSEEAGKSIHFYMQH